MHMDEHASITATTLNLMLLNQIAIRPALEKLSLWVIHCGSVDTHKNAMSALATLDVHTESISSGIERL